MEDTPIKTWLDELADRTPTPGGGAAAALAAATSAALVGMVTSYTTGTKWADRAARMGELNTQAARLRGQALGLIEQDAQAFSKVGAAYALPRGTDAEKKARREAIQQSLVGAAEPPVAIAQLAIELVAMADELVASGNPNVVSDVAVAASAARMALEAAIVNIEINAASIKDEDVVGRLRNVVAACSKAIRAADDVVSRVREVIVA
jgi:formiminotetrahydrofolate cyclodeaminase